MLPFLNKKAAQSGLIIENRAEPEPEEAPSAEPHEDPAIQACAAYLLQAIESKDIKSIAQALCHVFEIMREDASKSESGY